MRNGLSPGRTGSLDWIVDPTMTITLGSTIQATVFSTPNMVMLMERAAREALRPFLEDDEESVGVDVSTNHSGPAFLGDAVRGEALVTGVEGRRVHFDIRCVAGDREIGRGQHTRAVVHLSRLVEHNSRYNRQPGASMFIQPNSSTLPAMQTLKVQVLDRVAMVTIGRPEVLGAVSVTMTRELEQLVAWLAGHPTEVRVVIFTGSGTAFCAGDDVKELPRLSIEEARALSHQQARNFLSFEQLPQVTIAAVNGSAMGAGCVWAYSCDVRIASHSARFGMPEILLGWPPGYGIAQLTALIGKARALEMCMLGEPISAATAQEWGLVTTIVPSARLIDAAKQMADKLLKMPAEALRATKRLIHADEGQLPKVTFRADTEAYIRCLELPDAIEGMAAFAEKRPAKFKLP